MNETWFVISILLTFLFTVAAATILNVEYPLPLIYVNVSFWGFYFLLKSGGQQNKERDKK